MLSDSATGVRERCFYDPSRAERVPRGVGYVFPRPNASSVSSPSSLSSATGAPAALLLLLLELLLLRLPMLLDLLLLLMLLTLLWTPSESSSKQRTLKQ